MILLMNQPQTNYHALKGEKMQVVVVEKEKMLVVAVDKERMQLVASPALGLESSSLAESIFFLQSCSRK